ncbi:MAG: stage II sporulation protein M [Bacillota bacterium]
MNGYERKAPGRLASILISGWPVHLIVLFVFSVGLLVGSMSASRMDKAKSEELSLYIRDFVQKVEGVNFESARMAKNAMVNNMIMVAAIYLLGLTVIGMPVTLAILFVRGFVIGFAAGFLTGDLSLGGVLLTMAAILPHNLLYVPAICIGASSSIMFALLLLKRNFNTAVSVLPGFLKYTAIMAAVLLITMGAGFIEGYITPLFTKLAAGMISSGYWSK